ncbi:hypothetical protein [Pseudooceanicola nanhaiensis]|uniref:hypothetical protein n=1 Tax=Pseudooceanicola nanhaiensis TaxID=375761 RepID=UPI001CD253CF|nr:hypothetical protein [Pseudooceanicola nanhaiensis]MCA0922216.1 hypothetical protein [Pseudooceanicola nanhaiensis]
MLRGIFAIRLSPKRILKFAIGLTGIATLSACHSFPLAPSEYVQRLDQTPFVMQNRSEAWVATPTAQLVLERRFRNVSEQRISLPNRTSIPGENLILLQAHGTRYANVSRFMPVELLKIVGGVPAPFTSFDDLTLMSEQDALGTLTWAVWTNNANLNCVLAFRRFDGTNRTVPLGAMAMDMALRNCVYGTVEEALEPIGPGVTGYSAMSVGLGQRPQMLSPLAGPLP